MTYVYIKFNFEQLMCFVMFLWKKKSPPDEKEQETKMN